MVTSTVYTFPPFSSIAVFSWQGCKLKLKGKTEAAYVSDTLQMIHVHLHACLEERRIKAEAEDVKGPISLVVGPTDVGKSTFCRILLNYAARLGRKP
ncbi:Polyribonucleotide 5'-hydroxyl-kinase Clp1, partial [Stegodyphus mimosarum]